MVLPQGTVSDLKRHLQKISNNIDFKVRNEEHIKGTRKAFMGNQIEQKKGRVFL